MKKERKKRRKKERKMKEKRREEKEEKGMVSGLGPARRPEEAGDKGGRLPWVAAHAQGKEGGATLVVGEDFEG